MTVETRLGDGDLPAPATTQQFLVELPPNQRRLVTDATLKFERGSLPDIQLHCDSCGGVRNFETNGDFALDEHGDCAFVGFWCRNCDKGSKLFAISIFRTLPDGVDALKLGEFPPYSLRVPAKLATLLRESLELFQQGQRSESLGLGIGALTYYRRVVEAEHARLIGWLAKAAKTLEAHAVVAVLERAVSASRFSEASEAINAVLPESLSVSGQNPLALLYKATSRGIHEMSDLQCLELARDLRVVLVEMADRIQRATSDQREVKEAVRRIRGHVQKND